MSLQVKPFRGVRFDEKRFEIGTVLSPPYDVFTTRLEKKLRRCKENAVHLELPAGKGIGRYGRARRLWETWLKTGVLVQDPSPAFYIVEQRFRFRARSYLRTGILCALGLDSKTATCVLCHERTLAKPKVDRTRVLKTMKANTSPIFGIYPDARGAMRRVIAALRRKRPMAAGRDSQGVGVRMWRVDEPERVAAITQGLRSKRLLIADGHHRYEVARDFWKKTRTPGADCALAYLVSEEDSGLIVHPTHRVVRPSVKVKRAVESRCQGSPEANWKALETRLSGARSPYAFGLYNGGWRFMSPAQGDRGVPSRFGLDWLSRRIFSGVDPQDIAYFHAAMDSVEYARKTKGIAFLGRPFSVKDIRRAVERAGLLPQKSTYFFPKIGSGLVFRSF